MCVVCMVVCVYNVHGGVCMCVVCMMMYLYAL